MLKEICVTSNDLKLARNNLKELQERYKDEKDLLDFYEPSAKYLVKQLEDHLNYLISKVGGKDEEADKEI